MVLVIVAFYVQSSFNIYFLVAGCNDVIKKPKLDNHHQRCGASVSCVDCSVRFSGPKEWKSHTSCMTEAEKYQKSLYKGPKSKKDGKGGPRGAKESAQQTLGPAVKTDESEKAEEKTSEPSKGAHTFLYCSSCRYNCNSSLPSQYRCGCEFLSCLCSNLLCVHSLHVHLIYLKTSPNND